jgi:hypothetical protein
MFGAAGNFHRSRSIDPFWANVSLLLHMDGVNDGTNFTDSSSFNHTITGVNGAVTKTTQFKFGTASFYCASTQLTTPDSTDLQIGTDDWTIEAQIYPLSLSGYQTIIAKRDGYSTSAYYSFGLNSNQVFLYPGTGSNLGGGTVSANTWTHVAVERYGSTTTIYVAGTGTSIGDIVPNATYLTHTQHIGGLDTTAEMFNGYIDEVRITKGVARYRGNFTPPDAPFPNS